MDMLEEVGAEDIQKIVEEKIMEEVQESKEIKEEKMQKEKMEKEGIMVKVHFYYQDIQMEMAPMLNL